MSIIRHHGLKLLASGTALAAVLAFSAPVLAATPKDTLVLAWAIDDIITMDPGESFEISAGEIMGNTYQRLISFNIDDPSKLEGEIADSWAVSEDGLTYMFKLKKGLIFASGNPITAKDVAYSFQRAVKLDKSPAFILTQFGLTKDNVDERVRAVDDQTFVFRTDKSYAPSFVLNCFTANVAAVVDSVLVKKNEVNGDFGNAWLKKNYAGSGPMKIREWRPNEILVLERNEKYAGEKAKLPRVIYRHVKESATQRLLLEKGDVDIARNLEPGDLEAIAKNKDVTVTNTPKGTVYYFSLNQKNAILAKPEVREALKYLVDYDAIGATLIKGIGKIHQNFLPEGLLGASTNNIYKFDVAKAKELLAKAGYPDGFSVTMDVRNNQPVTGIAELVQRTYAQAGIKLELIPGDGKQTLTKYRARNHDIYIGQWGADYWDPHTNADTFARNPNNADNASSKTLAWRNAWDIPALTAKADKAVLERDTAKRVALYKDMQDEVLRTGPYVILYQMIETAGVRKNVGHFRLGPTSDSTYVYKVTKN